MKISSSFKICITISIFIFSTSAQTQARYYALFAYLRTQNIIRVFSIAQIQRLPAINRVTVLFHPVLHVNNLKKVTPSFKNPNPNSFPAGKAPVCLELSGINRPMFQHGDQLYNPTLTEYIQHESSLQIFKSNAVDPALRSQRDYVLNMAGIHFDLDGSYPGGPADSMNLLGLNYKSYPHIDISAPINKLNPEEIIHSDVKTLYPTDQQQWELVNHLQYEEAHLMAYFTNQCDTDAFTLTYVPAFKSYMAVFRGIYCIIMIPVHIFNSLTSS